MNKIKRRFYSVYIVPKTGTPKKIISNISRLEARRIIKRIPDTNSSFVGYIKRGTKVTNRSKFSY